MLIENSSNLIAAVTHQQLTNGVTVDVATLVNGTALVIAADSLSLYRSPQQVGDALGNGLIASVRLPFTLPQTEAGYLLEHRAGYAGLAGGWVLLITLNDVQVFASKDDALRNRHEQARLPLAH